MKNFKVVGYRIFDRYGYDVTDNIEKMAPKKLTRNLARKFKNLLNLIDPHFAPHRIAEVRITK